MKSFLLYRTLGLHISVMSAYHVHVYDKPLGQHPFKCFLLSHIFNSHTPQPKYLLAWNIQEVLILLSQHGVKQIDLKKKNLA